MARQLKVFVVPIGFHDAYVAAPSRKAALTAWGSTHDLFARGIAQEVTDAALTAEPLANPGKVIKRSRGSVEEQVAALPKDAPRTSAHRGTAKGGKPVSTPKPAKVEPRPSRDALDAAEQALSEAEKRHRAEDKVIAQKQAALDREKSDADRAHRDEAGRLQEAVDSARVRYDRVIERWRE